MTMRKAVALLVSVSLQACAQQAPAVAAAVPLFSKQHWKVTAGTCPIGCSDATRKFLSSQIGREVQLSSTQFAAPFDDPCEGALRYETRVVPASAVVADVNKGVAPAHRQMVPADLKLDAAGSITTAVALCHGGAGESTQARLLAIEPDRVLVLFEEQSVIELR